MKHIAAYAIAGMLALAAPGAAIASDADVLREVQDRAQIEQLMWNYVSAIDHWNPDAYAQVFTPDGAFIAGPTPTRGREALRNMVVGLKKSQDDRRAKGQVIGAMHHVMSNQQIEFVDRDHARVHYYWMTVFAGPPVAPPALSPPNVAAVGRGLDDVVRVDGKWLIQTRNVVAQN
jgi:uncharacterized protein (TIGR02246 family)